MRGLLAKWMLAANILCADDRDAMQKDMEELGQHISAGGTWALADECISIYDNFSDRLKLYRTTIVGAPPSTTETTAAGPDVAPAPAPAPAAGPATLKVPWVDFRAQWRVLFNDVLSNIKNTWKKEFKRDPVPSDGYQGWGPGHRAGSVQKFRDKSVILPSFPPWIDAPLQVTPPGLWPNPFITKVSPNGCLAEME
jgi:hypothetical protein